jgi:hypothetical protein
VSGLSNSKLVVVSAESVAEGKMEIEPSLTFTTSTHRFDSSWASQRLAGRESSYDIALRLTAGVVDTLEMGLAVPFVVVTGVDTAEIGVSAGSEPRAATGAGLGDMGWGLKWRFFEGDSLLIALLGGVTLPTGEHAPPGRRLPTGSGATVLESGLVLTASVGDLTLDTDVVAAIDTRRSASDGRLALVADFGVNYVIGKLRPAVELNYLLADLPEDHAHRISLSAGFTYTLRSWLVIVTGVQVDLLGRNAPKTLSYILAWTFTA